jgi:RNA polymerase sigma-70 factor (ECF subfamily)
MFARLYQRYYDDVYRYCIRRLFDQDQAEETTADVFYKAMHNLPSYKGSDSAFRYWLLRIATNTIHDRLRRLQRKKRFMQEVVQQRQGESGIDTAVSQEILERKKRLHQAILKLNPHFQAVITLHYFEQMKLVEIAACLGKKPSTVRNWLARATKKLRQELDTFAPGGELDHE